MNVVSESSSFESDGDNAIGVWERHVPKGGGAGPNLKLDVIQISPDMHDADYDSLNPFGIQGMVLLLDGPPKEQLEFLLPIMNREMYGDVLRETKVVPEIFDFTTDYGARKGIIFVYPWGENVASIMDTSACISAIDAWFGHLYTADVYPYGSTRTISCQNCYVSNWLEIVTWPQFESVFRLSSLHSQYTGSMGNLLKSNKNCLYSIWLPGAIPACVLNEFRLLQRQYLLPIDYDRAAVDTESTIIVD